MITKVSLSAAAVLLVAQAANAQQVFSGYDVIYDKFQFADWTLEANQDRITDNVWITRANLKGIFNIAQSAAYIGSGITGNSPLDTEWAFGNAVDYGSLTFTTWAVAGDGAPGANLVGQDMVVHLITDDMYFDIRLTNWGVGGGGGGRVRYERADIPAPATPALLGLGALICTRRRR